MRVQVHDSLYQKNRESRDILNTDSVKVPGIDQTIEKSQIASVKMNWSSIFST